MQDSSNGTFIIFHHYTICLFAINRQLIRAAVYRPILFFFLGLLFYYFCWLSIVHKLSVMLWFRCGCNFFLSVLSLSLQFLFSCAIVLFLHIFICFTQMMPQMIHDFCWNECAQCVQIELIFCQQFFKMNSH